MALFGDQMVFSAKAARDLKDHQYKAVRVSADNTVDVASLNATMTLGFVGILQNDPNAAGREARVAFIGASKAVAGGTIAAGEVLSHNSSGFMIVATSGLMVVGQAMEAAVANGIFRMLILRGAMAQVA